MDANLRLCGRSFRMALLYGYFIHHINAHNVENIHDYSKASTECVRELLHREKSSMATFSTESFRVRDSE